MNSNRSRFVRISYDIASGMAVYPGNPANRIDPVDSLELGGACNTFTVTLFNHNGTHIDAPRHFDREGRTIGDYRIDEFIFENPLLADVPKKAGEAITEEDLVRVGMQESDVLLIRTGFYRQRETDSYTDDNPWLSPGGATFIRSHCRQLKAIGIDTVSIGSHRRPVEAAETHRIMLKRGPFPSTPPLLIEDLNLGLIENPLGRFFAVPLFVSLVDGIPCTAFVEVAS